MTNRTHKNLNVGLPKPDIYVVLAVIAAVWGGIVVVAMSPRSWYATYPNENTARVQSVREFIDPNTATPASLQRLSGIGLTRAEAIVTYRQQHGPVAFEVSTDLEKIRGIGPKTVKKNREYLIFPSERKEGPRQ